MPPLRSTGHSPEAERPEYAGQYRLESCLGTGGMGVVHLATSDSGLRLAVKVIHTEHASDPEFRARFRQEVAAARRVSGAFTASVVDADPTAGRPWMATLFIEGPTLSERVKRSPLGEAELRRMGAGLAEALRDIHRAGVVHRDLKPSNVLLAPDGPKVIDFGISRPTDSDLRTETGKLIGTPPFMAPEQFQRPREVGPAADVFALGSVLVYAATGRGPFDSDSPYIVAYQVVHDEPQLTGVPADLVPLLLRCLSKDPDERPTPYEVMVALRGSTPSASYDTQAHIPVPRTPDPREWAPAVSKAPDPQPTAAPDADPDQARVSRWAGRRRRRWAAAGAAAMALAVAAGVVAAVVGSGDEEPGRTPPARGFTGWSVTLRSGNEEHRTPVCTPGPGLSALYCAAPGLKAVRLDPDTGRTGWSLEAGGGAAAQSDVGAAPVFAGGLLHVVTPGGGRLEALDPKTGAVRWDARMDSYSEVRHIGDTVLLIGEGGRIRALDAATGAKRWDGRHGGIGTQWVSAPGARGPALAATPSADGMSTLITAVDPGDGRRLWQRPLKGELRPVQLSGGDLYLLSVNRDGSTDAVVRLGTAGAGAAVRRVPVAVPALDQAQAVVAKEIVYLSGAGGSLLAIDTGAGREQEKWRREMGATHLSRPTADGRAVYVTAGDGRLLAVDAGRGVLVGQTDPRMDDGRFTFASMLGAPVVGRGRVYGAAPDGGVFGVSAKRVGR
ncbi:serine/threonine protein kinase [Streptomyces inusitatus]|uniref:Serine/threonine protein kinase n=1 Tax=Streptomyces inusitatus TaxID=68221 RepID=A0A918UHE6_9ACTN|nr:serine/threonine-protein kinase [Streptomyces inusitatus]GGZ12225.1 serine/threonine protein kinase [Streptomyces inusitatus]